MISQGEALVMFSLVIADLLLRDISHVCHEMMTAPPVFMTLTFGS